MIFYNELLSVILRTVWSVILQTPSHLLKEIILVDDASTEGKINFIIHSMNTDHDKLQYYNKKLLNKKIDGI